MVQLKRARLKPTSPPLLSELWDADVQIAELGFAPAPVVHPGEDSDWLHAAMQSVGLTQGCC